MSVPLRFTVPGGSGSTSLLLQEGLTRTQGHTSQISTSGSQQLSNTF